MIKILFIFGTRPEAIKLAPVIHKFKQKKDGHLVKVCVTSQHRKMLDDVLNLFAIRPNYDLDIMKEDQSLFDITIEGLKGLKQVLKKENPDIILVQGDTTTTFIASLAAYYSQVKIGHIEAGLRTQDKFNPFPEEINRKATDCMADFLFAPTETAKKNLLKEGIKTGQIFVTGNTVIDALLMTAAKQKDKKAQGNLNRIFEKQHSIIFGQQRILLATGHRRESFGKDLENVCYGLKKIADNYPKIKIVYSVHLNPNVQKTVRKILGAVSNIHLINPLDYSSFVYLMSRAYLILTDSGGIQEEAPSLGKPVLVMRQTTERPEGINSGTAKLVGTHYNRIYSETKKILESPELYKKIAVKANPFGDGKASERILKIISHKLSK